MSTSTEGVMVPEWDLADRLGKALQVADVSVQQMADYLDVHRNTVSAWLGRRGKAPKRPIVIAWALATGVSLDWLWSGSDSPEQPDPGGDIGSPTPDSGAPSRARTYDLRIIRPQFDDCPTEKVA